ncbi:unnamed protein product [Penicillium roqueforti FM164]|uniref:Genomic scaffold, ProqFM164S01 n=1 Tax=Penicillium roqueforti (strain FM164) TaxID=1365484 RepID=W6PTF2_PENRF|nr:unnamed protein product [Penicillium roqueforti FM164]
MVPWGCKSPPAGSFPPLMTLPGVLVPLVRCGSSNPTGAAKSTSKSVSRTDTAFLVPEGFVSSTAISYT